MKAFLKYASYVARHKWFVFVECCKLGIPWRGLVHDLSKFRPDEWLPYQRYFYGKRVGGHGYWHQAGDNAAFDAAWLRHQHRNPHHWQFWLLREDSGALKALEMPLCYRKEMLADWRGAGKAQGKRGPNECAEWYRANAHKMVLGDYTRAWIEMSLGVAL